MQSHAIMTTKHNLETVYWCLGFFPLWPNTIIWVYNEIKKVRIGHSEAILSFQFCVLLLLPTEKLLNTCKFNDYIIVLVSNYNYLFYMHV